MSCSRRWRCCPSAPRRCSSASPTSPTSSSCIAPKDRSRSRPTPTWASSSSACRARARRTPQVTKNAPPGTTIRRFDGDAADASRRCVSGQVAGGRRQHLLHPAPRTRRSPACSRTSSNSPELYNGACTRLGEKEINASSTPSSTRSRPTASSTKIYDEVDEQTRCRAFPDSIRRHPLRRQLTRRMHDVGHASALSIAATAEHDDRDGGVEKWYGTFQALTDINLSVRASEKIVLCGPSGSGKSTLIRCINHLENYQKGEIVVDGVAADDSRKADRRRAPRGRHGVPAVQPVPAYDGAGELHAGADALSRHAAQARPRRLRGAARPRVKSSTRRTNIRPNCPAVSSSASRSRGRCAWSPR